MEKPTLTSPENTQSKASGISSVPTPASDDISLKLRQLAGWTYQPEAGGAINKEFRFADFVGAFGFMAQVAMHAERLNHHPEWTNVYDRVTVRLTTHDAAGLSAKDFEMAREMDRLHASGADTRADTVG